MVISDAPLLVSIRLVTLPPGQRRKTSLKHVHIMHDLGAVYMVVTVIIYFEISIYYSMGP